MSLILSESSISVFPGDTRASFLTRILRSLAHSNCVHFNQTALRAVVKPENISSSETNTLQVLFLLSPFPIVSVAVWITVFARFGRCLNRQFPDG